MLIEYSSFETLLYLNFVIFTYGFILEKDTLDVWVNGQKVESTVSTFQLQ